MVKKKKLASKKTRVVKKQAQSSPFFMGLSKAQTQSLAVGSIVVGLGLFALATFTWKNKTNTQMAIAPTTVVTITMTPTVASQATMSATPTLTKMISATSTARMTDRKPPVKQLPNTSSKVTYTVEVNDSLAKIGKKLCGSDRAWLSIAETNGLLYPYTIQPGEEYIITCY